MPEEDRSEAPIGPQTCAPGPDAVIRGFAEGQHGVVAWWQLTRAGVTRKAVRVRLERGRLLPLHRGVYAVGHQQLRREGRWLAAVLAIGPGAVLSHREAAALHGIRPSDRFAVDVTAGRGRAGTRAIHVHRAKLDPADVTMLRRIPVTMVARTLLDLAAIVRPDHLAKALREAERQHLLDVGALHDAMARTRGRRGRGHDEIKRALRELADLGTTLSSPLEVAFSRLIAEAGLPKPQTNVHLNGIEADALWAEQHLIVELDGWEHHRGRHAFQRDRTRDAELARAGYRVIRFTHRDVTQRPAWVVETLRDLLA